MKRLLTATAVVSAFLVLGADAPNGGPPLVAPARIAGSEKTGASGERGKEEGPPPDDPNVVAIIAKSGVAFTKDERGNIAQLHGNLTPRRGAPHGWLVCLKKLPSLRGLELGYATTDEDMENVKELIRLERLNLFGAGITDAGLANVRNLKGLRDLNLYDVRGVTDAGLENLAGLTQLRTLNLSNVPVTDRGLRHLTNMAELTHLFLSGTRITDAGLDNVKGLGKLLSLDVSGTALTDGAVDRLIAVPNLKIVNGKSTGISERGASSFAKSAKGRLLSLSKAGARRGENPPAKTGGQ
jgi:hypothetical protein